MFKLFEYLVWLVVSLLCLMIATISVSEFLVNCAVDARYDAKLADYALMLAAEAHPEEPA